MAKVTGTGGGRVTGVVGKSSLSSLASKLVGKKPSASSRAPVSLPPGPKVPSGSGGRLYSESAYSDGKIASSYRDLVRQGASPSDAVGIIRMATRMSPQPRTSDEIRRIVGLG